MKRGLTLAPVLLALACGGAGPYGYAPESVPAGPEDEHLEAVENVTYEEIRRDPVDFGSTTVGWFGVVTGVEAGEGGETLVHLTYRTLQPRNLCADERDSSCRVTVSERAGGPFSAILALRPEEEAGSDRLWVGSLVKVYGQPTGDFDADGGPVLRATWHRHWPHGTYVTTAARGSMRR